jgi:CDP-diacylglycerol--glycerol-3-phosphate 3-phosphatidyltransferase
MSVDRIIDKNKPGTLTDWARARLKSFILPVARFLLNLGLSPNVVTLIGLIGSTVGAVLLARGHMLTGGLLIVFMGSMDALDGTMARLRGIPTDFGAFFDSVTDRYSEIVVYAGLLFFYLGQNNHLMVGVVYAAVGGSLLVSYTRARGHSLGMDTKVGILSRMERYLVLAPSLIFNIPSIGMWIIAILANVTAVQRILDIRRQSLIQSQNQP